MCPDDEQWLQRLIARRRSGYTLESPFYCDHRIFQRETERVFHRNWLLVGHVAKVKKPGDFFVVNVGDTPLIIVRGRDEHVRALVNVCRHRGSLVCTQQEGNSKSFVCPYHAWVYDHSGKLRMAKSMPDGFDAADHGLHSVAVRIIEGMIFISLAEEPLDLGQVVEGFSAYLVDHGLADAKIAHQAQFPMKGNWKLAIENYLECYHCLTAHPEFAAVHPRADTVGMPEMGDDDAEHMLKWIEKAQSFGHQVGGVGKEWSGVSNTEQDFGVARVPLGPGYKTSSSDGEPIAPLMGSLQGFDGGQTYFSVGPTSYGVADSDHAILIQFIPVSPRRTDVMMTWLVESNAEEGSDYQLDRLTWLWDATMRQDQKIVDQQQKGVGSRHYVPGPFSQQEAHLDRWVEWYLAQIR